MKAILCTAFGPPETLKHAEIDPPTLGPDGVRIEVHAVGVNFPDLLLIEGKYQLRPPFPFVPGMECAGDVLEVGAAVTGLAVGQRVLTSMSYGCMAEEAVAPAKDVVPIPDAMPYAHGAAFPVAYGTSYHALVERAQLKAGEILVVHGAAGGVGLTAVEIGNKLGATVVATGGSDEKLKIAQQYGADHLINYRTEDLRERIKALTDGRGADVIYDPVGGDVFDISLRALAWRGRLLVIGFAAGRIAEAKTNIILLKEAHVIGVAWGAFAHRHPEANRAYMETMLGWYAEGALKPHISRTLPLAEVTDALEALRARKVVGKQVLEVP